MKFDGFLSGSFHFCKESGKRCLWLGITHGCVNGDCSSRCNHGSAQCEKRPFHHSSRHLWHEKSRNLQKKTAAVRFCISGCAKHRAASAQVAGRRCPARCRKADAASPGRSRRFPCPAEIGSVPGSLPGCL